MTLPILSDILIFAIQPHAQLKSKLFCDGYGIEIYLGVFCNII